MFGISCPAQHETRRKRDNWKENIFLLRFPSTATENFLGIGELQNQEEAASGKSRSEYITRKSKLQGTPKDRDEMAKEKRPQETPEDGNALIHPQNSITHKCLLANYSRAHEIRTVTK